MSERTDKLNAILDEHSDADEEAEPDKWTVIPNRVEYRRRRRLIQRMQHPTSRITRVIKRARTGGPDPRKPAQEVRRQIQRHKRKRLRKGAQSRNS